MWASRHGGLLHRLERMTVLSSTLMGQDEHEQGLSAEWDIHREAVLSSQVAVSSKVSILTIASPCVPGCEAIDRVPS